MAGVDDALDALFPFFRRKDCEAVLQDFDGRVEQLVRGTLAEPLLQLREGRGAGLDFPLLRKPQDRLMLLSGNRAVGPGYLHQRSEEESRRRIDRNS